MILNDILSVKYKGFCTANSFNTPKGITKQLMKQKAFLTIILLLRWVLVPRERLNSYVI